MNCPNCGSQIADTATFCGYCGQPLAQQQQPVYQQPVYEQPVYEQPVYQQPVTQQPPAKIQQENMLMGIIGALIGAALGGLVIFLFLKMEIIAALSGLAVAFFTLKGYEMLGKNLSKMGIVICVIIMLIIPWLAHEIYWATEIMDTFNADFADAFESVSDLVKPEAYEENLVTLYIFTILGGAALVFNTFKNQKTK